MIKKVDQTSVADIFLSIVIEYIAFQSIKENIHGEQEIGMLCSKM